MGPTVCRSLWNFVFNYQNVGSGTHNHAMGLTDEAVLRLAENCPNLRYVQLQGTSGLTDSALVYFFQRCADLTDLEITGKSSGRSTIKGTCFDTLRERPDWCPKLIKISVEDDTQSKIFMKPMRELTRTREQLLVQLVWVHGSGDMLRKNESNYLKGRIQNDMKYIKRKKDGYKREKPVWNPRRYAASKPYRDAMTMYWHNAHTWSQSRLWREFRRAGL